MKNTDERDTLLHEKNRYRDPSFPVGLYIADRKEIIPDGRGYSDLHWHEELQITYMLRGHMIMQIDGKDYPIEEHQAVYIPGNALHESRMLSVQGKYMSINFPDKLVSFFAGSRMETEDVFPYARGYTVSPQVFSGKLDWHSSILQTVRALAGILEQREGRHWEYQVSLMLVNFWYQMITHLDGTVVKNEGTSERKSRRIRVMMEYIHEHYPYPIQLEDIAEAAGVSKGECCRCFKEMTRQTPNQYLIRYRIAKGMEMLNQSAESVTQIALAAGFSDSSHFIRYFKRETGMTPLEYRSKMK